MNQYFIAGKGKKVFICLTVLSAFFLRRFLEGVKHVYEAKIVQLDFISSITVELAPSILDLPTRSHTKKLKPESVLHSLIRV